jgi:hypothetical protein
MCFTVLNIYLYDWWTTIHRFIQNHPILPEFSQKSCIVLYNSSNPLFEYPNTLSKYLQKPIFNDFRSFSSLRSTKWISFLFSTIHWFLIFPNNILTIYSTILLYCVIQSSFEKLDTISLTKRYKTIMKRRIQLYPVDPYNIIPRFDH